MRRTLVHFPILVLALMACGAPDTAGTTPTTTAAETSTAATDGGATTTTPVVMTAVASTTVATTVTTNATPTGDDETADDGRAGFTLESGGVSFLPFGTESGEALATFEFVLGSPSTDTDWITGDGSTTCASVARTVAWVLPEENGFASSIFTVLFHDLGYSNPAFARWEYVLTDQGDRDLYGTGVLATADGVSVGVGYGTAVALGYERGGYEEIGDGSLDGIRIHTFNATGGIDEADYLASGWVGVMSAGTRECFFEEP